MNITIFYGPEEEFNNIIPEDGKNLSLLYFVTVTDLLKELRLEKANIEFDCLVVKSSEYAGVNTHFIEGFSNYLEFYQAMFGYEEVFLHNPPNTIVEQMRRRGSEWEINIKKHTYSKLTKKSLIKIKSTFDDVVFGQEQAKSEILHSIYSLVGNSKSLRKPVVLMLYGPAGVGKTETAKLLNKVLNGKKLLRRQMSMLHNSDSSSYIFGSRSRSFAKDLIDRETNVILLDEFDKANAMFYNAFYQMFDEGVFVDENYVVDLTTSIILCTSNYHSTDEIREKLGDALYSRFDNLIPYYPLPISAKRKILEKSYKEELKKLSWADQEYLEPFNLLDRMEDFLPQYENAREIQKAIAKLIAFPLVNKL